MGWFHIKKLVLPPSVKKLENDALRGLSNLENLYYCGTYNIDTPGIFTEKSNSFNIHVSKDYPTNYFGDKLVTNHNLICDESYIGYTKCNCNNYIQLRFLIIFIIIFINK